MVCNRKKKSCATTVMGYSKLDLTGSYTIATVYYCVCFIKLSFIVSIVVFLETWVNCLKSDSDSNWQNTYKYFTQSLPGKYLETTQGSHEAWCFHLVKVKKDTSYTFLYNSINCVQQNKVVHLVVCCKHPYIYIEDFID